jgi:hypothetical protein
VLKHLVILAVVGCLVFGGIYGVESIIAKHDLATQNHYSQLLATQTALTQSIEAKLATDEAGWAQQAAALTKQNNQLAQQVVSRDAQLSALITKIGTMQPPAIVADLQPKLRAGTATVQPNGVLLDVPAARDVDEQITEGTTAKSDLAATKTQLGNETVIATNAEKDAAETKTALTAEQTKNGDQVKACNAQITTLKAQSRKGKLKWFGIGYVAGLISGFTLHLAK